MSSSVLIKAGFIGLLILAVAIEVLADIFFKRWVIEEKNAWFIIGMVIYVIGTCFWAFSLKYDYLSKAASIFNILNLIALVLVGVVLFKEDLSLANKIGIGLGILSVLLLEL